MVISVILLCCGSCVRDIRFVWLSGCGTRIILSCCWHIRFVLLCGYGARITRFLIPLSGYCSIGARDYCVVGCGGLKLSWVVVVRHFVSSFNPEGTPDPLCDALLLPGKHSSNHDDKQDHRPRSSLDTLGTEVKKSVRL